MASNLKTCYRCKSDTKENLAIACPHCNFTKINKTTEEFFEYNTIKSSCG